MPSIGGLGSIGNIETVRCRNQLDGAGLIGPLNLPVVNRVEERVEQLLGFSLGSTAVRPVRHRYAALSSTRLADDHEI